MYGKQATTMPYIKSIFNCMRYMPVKTVKTTTLLASLQCFKKIDQISFKCWNRAVFFSDFNSCLISFNWFLLPSSIQTTVEPPVSDHPKCQDWVVAYGRWSLMRGQTIGGLSVSSLAYGNCWVLRPHAPILIQTRLIIFSSHKNILTSLISRSKPLMGCPW